MVKDAKKTTNKKLLHSGSHAPNSEESQVLGSFTHPPNHVSCSFVPPPIQIPHSFTAAHIHVHGSSVPSRTQVPRHSRSFAPPPTHIPRSLRASAPQHIQVPRYSAPPLRQGTSSTSLVQSPSSSSTSEVNHVPSSQDRQHVAGPPLTQSTTVPTLAPAPTPTPYQLDPAFIIRSSSRHWTVNVLNPSGGSNRVDMTLQKLLELEEGFRIIVDFERLATYGLVAGLLGVVCVLMATDYEYFPISFKSWHVVPFSYFDNAWKNIFENKKLLKILVFFLIFRQLIRLGRDKSEHGGRVQCLGRGALPSVNLKLSRRKFRGTSVYEVGETSGSSKLEGALREIDLLKSIIKKIVLVAEYEKVFRETLQEEDDENDESSGGSNGQ
ncbi:hypothetical protein ACFE04_002373 [Oxalis oulophora]